WGNYEEGEQYITFDFTREVSAEDFMDAVTLVDTRTNASIPFTLETAGTTSYHEIKVHLSDPADASVRVKVAAGLQGSEGTQLTSTYEQTLTQRAVDLIFSNHYMQNSQQNGYQLNVSMSAPVKIKDLREH